MSYTGWLLPDNTRDILLAIIPSVYPDVVAHHITYKFPGTISDVPPEASTEVVGVADDGDGVQALVVSVNGSTDRPDGSKWHITWSLDKSKGRKAVESNFVIQKFGYSTFEMPIPIRVVPTLFE